MKKRYNLIQKFNYKVIIKLLLNIDTDELLSLINYKEDDRDLVLRLLQNLTKKDLLSILSRKNHNALEDIETDMLKLSIDETTTYNALPDECISQEVLPDERELREVLIGNFVFNNDLEQVPNLLQDDCVSQELLTNECTTRDVYDTEIALKLINECNTREQPIGIYDTRDDNIFIKNENNIMTFSEGKKFIEQPISTYDTRHLYISKCDRRDKDIDEYDYLEILFNKTLQKSNSIKNGLIGNSFSNSNILTDKRQIDYPDIVIKKLPNKILYEPKEKSVFLDAVQYLQNIIIDINLKKIEIDSNESISSINSDIKSKIKLIT